MSDRDIEEWKLQMRIAIQAASIVRQCHDTMAAGFSVPRQADMKCIIEKAIEIADLFESVVDDEMPPREPK